MKTENEYVNWDKAKESDKNIERVDVRTAVADDDIYTIVELLLQCTHDVIWKWDLTNDEYYSSIENGSLLLNQPIKRGKALTDWENLIHPEDLHQAKKTILKYLTDRQTIYESSYRVRDKNGKYRSILSRGVGIKNASGKYTMMVGIHTDLTEMVDLKSKVYHLAYYDSLTQLANKEKLKSVFNNLVENKKIQIGLIYVDIDDFSFINHIYGFDFGDQVLKEIASCLVAFFGEKRRICRGSGGSFMVLHKIENKQDLNEVKIKLENFIKSSMKASDLAIEISICMGSAMYPIHGSDFGSLFRSADAALYHAKKNGFSTKHIFDEKIKTNAYNKNFIRNKINTALSNNEFSLSFHSFVCSKTDDIIGFEALIRWQQSDGSFIAPLDFIPLAEETGQIIEIEKWVINAALKEISCWNRKYNPRIVSINISSKGLLKENLIQYLMDKMRLYKVDPKFILLEITETALLDDLDKTLRIIKDLKELGIQIALDDFGTGYSSINYLISLPVDIIKIDKQLTQKIISNERIHSILHMIIEATKKLQIKIIVEGVEKKEELEVIKTMGSDYTQGFYHARPQRLDEYYDVIAT